MTKANNVPIETSSPSSPIGKKPATIAAYDVKLKEGMPLTNRTSYVIAPDGKIIYAYTNMDFKDHVANTMAAVKAWKAHHPRG